jgi:DNA-binding Xre family transcriptional regulator
MITLRIKELGLQKGIKPTIYLLNQIGIGKSAAKNYLNGKAKSISFEHLDKLCIFFNCTPQEILKVMEPVPKNHPLAEWLDYGLPFPMQEFRDMSPAQLKEAGTVLREIMERKV